MSPVLDGFVNKGYGPGKGQGTLQASPVLNNVTAHGVTASNSPRVGIVLLTALDRHFWNSLPTQISRK
jgi:hypothetical protein